MQTRILVSLIIFIGSYLPLSLILLAQDFDYSVLGKPLCWKFWLSDCSLPFKNSTIAIAILVACAACFAVTLVSLMLVRPKHEIVIQEAKHIPADLMNYTLPYIVSFMSIDYQEPNKFVGLLIFLGWMFWITYKSGQIILNPMLVAFGWRLYEISYNFVGGSLAHNSNALVHGSIEAGEHHRQMPIQDILILKAVSVV